ncbi:MAG: hypothetical protein EKK55_18305 [Rhodocyclaceae bacterium]|nr:MAG: hypothetical protein EKK55_18305 [Rhodocyclaceae bacterium]
MSQEDFWGALADAQGHDDLRKALTVGSGDPSSGSIVAGSIAGLMPEDLSPTLYNLAIRESDLNFWGSLFVESTTNVIAQYVQKRSHGDHTGAFISELDLPGEANSVWKRESVQVKFAGVTRRNSIVSEVVAKISGANGSTKAEELTDAVIDMKRVLEQASFYGDSALIPQEFDGLAAQLRARGGLPCDLRGDYIKLGTIDAIVARLMSADRNGEPNVLIAGHQEIADFVRDYVRIDSNATPVMRTSRLAERDTDLGVRVKRLVTQMADLDLMPSKFLIAKGAPVAAGRGDASKRPLPPIVTGTATPANSGPIASKFFADDAGEYYYYIVAQNRYGRSAPTSTGQIANVAAGDQVEITVQDGGQDADSYIVYRSPEGGALADAKEIFRVPKTGASQTIVDRNWELPGKNIAFVLTKRTDTMRWRQLMPLTKFELGMIDTSFRTMLLIYGALQIMAPRMQCYIYNVGRDPNAPELIETTADFTENWTYGH